jgi:pentatricopeptide repeat protein
MNILKSGKVFKYLLDEMTRGLRVGAAVPATPTEVLYQYEHLGIWEKFKDFGQEAEYSNVLRYAPSSIRYMWRSTIGILTDGLVLELARPSLQSERVELILGELLSVWKLLFQLKGPRDVRSEAIEESWSLPSPDTLELSMNNPSASLDLPRRLQVYHPKCAGTPAHGFSAVLIFSLLKDNSPFAVTISDAVRAQAAPLMELMVHVLPGARMSSIFPHLEHSTDLRELPDDFRKEIINQIRISPHDALNIIGPQTLAKPASKPAPRPASRPAPTAATPNPVSPAATSEDVVGEDLVGEDLLEETPIAPRREGAKPSGPGDAAAQEEFFLKRIERQATEATNLAGVEALWTNAVRTYTTKQKTQIPLVIYNAFLTSYLRLFAADRTVEVWNHMIRHEVQPNVTTWTAMLTGCTKARDKEGLNATWKRMIQARVQPDVYAWATRIHGLIALRQVNDGFAAMDEMGKQWLAAERASQSLKKGPKKTKSKTVPNTLPKPTIEVVNGAASAFNDVRNLSFDQKSTSIRKILQWASNFAIKPDTQTYNILIQLHMSADDFPTVFKLTRAMKAEGIEGDIVTYTMLMRASLNNIASLAPAEQEERVMSLLSEFDNLGLKVNAYVYSSTIDQLLTQPVPNIPAVQSLVAHMQSRDLIPSPQIYTSLITHYFKQSPPDIEAVDALWSRIISIRGTPTDQKLLERLIEGYARVDEVGKMMAVLNRMSKRGMVPAWYALAAVLECLVRAEDWERVEQLMKDVTEWQGVAKGGVLGGNNGQNYFFRQARALGVLGMQGGGSNAWLENPRLDVGEARIRQGPIGEQPEHDSGQKIERRGEEAAGQEAFGEGVKEQDVVEHNAQYEEQVPQELWAREDEDGENGSVGGVPL